MEGVIGVFKSLLVARTDDALTLKKNKRVVIEDKKAVIKPAQVSGLMICYRPLAVTATICLIITN